MSADTHDAAWLQHSRDRIAARRALDAKSRAAKEFPGFLQAFPALRAAAQHEHAVLLGAITCRQFAPGEIMSHAASPALVYLLAGEALSMDTASDCTDALGKGGTPVLERQGVGEALLVGSSMSPECAPIIKASCLCTALVLSLADLAELKSRLPDSVASEFDARLRLHQAWHHGCKATDQWAKVTASAAEVKDLVRVCMDAVRRDDAAMIRKMSDKKALLALSDPCSPEGGAIHIAVSRKQHACLDALLELEVSPNARSGTGHTPLHMAALIGDDKAIVKLLSARGSPDSSARNLRTPLHTAAQEGHHEIVKTLLAAAAAVDVQDSRLVTPMHLAVRHSHPHVVRALLLAGCSLNKRDLHGRSVWHEARHWSFGDTDGCDRAGRAAVYDMVHLVFTREKYLNDALHPCGQRDRSYLEMPAKIQPEPEKAKASAFNLV